MKWKWLGVAVASIGLAFASVQALDWQSLRQTDSALAEPRTLRPEFLLRNDLTPWPQELAFVRTDSIRSELELRTGVASFVSVEHPEGHERFRLRFLRRTPQVIELRYHRESASGLATGALLTAGYFLVLAVFAVARQGRRAKEKNLQAPIAPAPLAPSVASVEPTAADPGAQLNGFEAALRESSNKVVVIVPARAPEELRWAATPRSEPKPAPAREPTPEPKIEIEKPIAVGAPPIPSNRTEATRALSFRLKSPMIFLAYSPRDSALILECEAGFSSDDFSPHTLKPRVPFELDLRVFSDGYEESARVFEESLPLSRFLLNRYGVAFFEAIPWVRALSEIDPRVGNRFQGIFVVLQPGLESLSLKGQIRSQLSETWSDDDSKANSRTENSPASRPRDPLA